MRTVLLTLFSFAFLAPASAGPLNDAAKKGDIEEIRRLLDDGADVNEADTMASPLHYAAMRGHAEAIGLLATRGASLDAPSKMGSPLVAAAQFGQVEATIALLEAGADPNVGRGDQATPLMVAAFRKQTDVAKVLLAGGADPNVIGIASFRASINGPATALHISIVQGSEEIAELLRENGAEPMPPEVPLDLAERGNAERGRILAQQTCGTCHTVLPEGEPLIGHVDAGPPLIGVIGRPVADLPGFEYSNALKAHGGVWTPERIYAFALRPMLTVPGTRMDWAPDRTPGMIADIVAYLVSEYQ
ncbi:ankyrin repeat domain-containing protein [Tropicimonas sp. IMCC6043]|uniref:ankyrin repeat domain-containing protein n=1 Tax=Tropicimonas sp. IMCC6043 TaxID=2510645 RepID=UPI00101D592A|nr:ankyrin repeat domain-containing protein [Tropicimonas sp. IMCC6043]RYH12167.1 c-type cytochrome [Tropicimonas sp. IMCC6043]